MIELRDSWYNYYINLKSICVSDIKGTAYSLIKCRNCPRILYGCTLWPCINTKMAAIKHADAKLDCFIASNQLKEPIVTSLVARKTPCFGTLLDGSKWWLMMVDEWCGDHMGLERLVNLGPVPTGNTLVLLNVVSPRILSPNGPHPECHKSDMALSNKETDINKYKKIQRFIHSQLVWCVVDTNDSSSIRWFTRLVYLSESETSTARVQHNDHRYNRLLNYWIVTSTAATLHHAWKLETWTTDQTAGP